MIERPSGCKVVATAFLTLAGAALSLLAADAPSRQPFTEPLKGVSMVWVDDPAEPDGGYWRSKDPQPLKGPNIELYCRTLTYRSRGRGFFPEHYAFGYKEPFLVVKAASEPKPEEPSPNGIPDKVAVNRPSAQTVSPPDEEPAPDSGSLPSAVVRPGVDLSPVRIGHIPAPEVRNPVTQGVVPEEMVPFRKHSPAPADRQISPPRKVRPLSPPREGDAPFVHSSRETDPPAVPVRTEETARQREELRQIQAPPSPSGPNYREKKGLLSGIISFISGERREQKKMKRAEEKVRQASSKKEELIGNLRSVEHE